MADENSAGEGRGHFLTKRWGPLPVWGWGIAGVAGVVAFIYVRRKQASSAATAAAAAQQQQTAASLTPGDYGLGGGSSALGGLTGAFGGPGTFSSTVGGGSTPASTASGGTTSTGTPTGVPGRQSLVPVGVQGYQTPGSFTGSNAPAANAYVQGLYEQYLGRPGEAAGVNYWSQQLTSGASPSQVAYEIANSPEAYSIRAQGFQPAGIA